MSIIITNITNPPTKTGENKYEVKINNQHIAYFTHNREEGLSKCLNLAGFAVAASQMEVIWDKYYKGKSAEYIKNIPIGRKGKND